MHIQILIKLKCVIVIFKHFVKFAEMLDWHENVLNLQIYLIDFDGQEFF